MLCTGTEVGSVSLEVTQHVRGRAQTQWAPFEDLSWHQGFSVWPWKPCGLRFLGFHNVSDTG